MSEEPKSFWKKPWHGPMAWLLAWAGLMVATAVIFWLVLSILGNTRPYESDPLFVATEVVITGLFLLVALVRWLCCWRNVKRLLFGLACGATLLALFFAEENWRGRRAWLNYKQEWEARGEKYDLKDFVPPPVPDDQNFAMTPIWVESIKATLGPERARLWYGDKFPDNGRTNFVERLRLDIYHSDQTAMPEMERPRPGNWENGEATDLRAWQKYYRVSSFTNQPEKKTPFYYPAKAFINSFPVAPQPQSPAADVLLALSKYDPVIEELRRASQLPYSRFPLEYDKDDPAAILLPHLAALKRSSQMLQLRAVAELQAGRSDQALADIKLNFRLMEAVRSEPFIISQLVRFAILQLTLQPVYEGLAEHRWSDAQLVELEGELAKLDCLQDYAISIRCEPAAHIKLIDYMERDRGRGLRLLDELDRFDLREDRLTFGTHVLFYLAPKGWFYQNELRLAQLNQQWNQPMVDATKRVVVPQMAQEHKAAEAKLEGTPYGFLAQTLLPWLGTYAQKTALAQNAADMARVALALERSRLAHGNYPETLEGLAPQFIATLPHDVIGGGPLKYRRTSDGRFVLYSIGWNEKDDGGVVVFDQGVRDVIGNFNRNEGDWDWQYPK